jgi:uncharacterized protein (DUF433 family)
MSVWPGISINPNIMVGVPCIAGTRVPVVTVMRMVDAGMTIDAILDDYPYLTAEGIHAAIAYTAAGSPGNSCEAGPDVPG